MKHFRIVYVIDCAKAEGYEFRAPMFIAQWFIRRAVARGDMRCLDVVAKLEHAVTV